MASGQLGRLAGALKRMLLLKERVGSAPGGLSYFRRTERNDHGEDVEKRWVKFPASAGHGFYDPAAIAPEWSQVTAVPLQGSCCDMRMRLLSDPRRVSMPLYVQVHHALSSISWCSG